jgi:TonB family protein
MNRCLLPLIALASLLSACSSPAPTTAQAPARAIPTGTRTTTWGERPSYDQSGHYFKLTGRPSVNAFDAKITFDVLVNPDGTVHDVALLSSTGNAKFDGRILARFKGARYTLRLDPADPAPHVVRQTVEFKTASADRGHDQRHIDTRNYSGAGPQPPTSGPPAGSYSYTTTRP